MIANILKKEMEKSNGAARLVKVPPERRPNAKSLLTFEHEIAVQVGIDDSRLYRNSVEEEDTTK